MVTWMVCVAVSTGIASSPDNSSCINQLHAVMCMAMHA